MHFVHPVCSSWLDVPASFYSRELSLYYFLFKWVMHSFIQFSSVHGSFHLDFMRSLVPFLPGMSSWPGFLQQIHGLFENVLFFCKMAPATVDEEIKVWSKPRLVWAAGHARFSSSWKTGGNYKCWCCSCYTVPGSFRNLCNRQDIGRM